MKVGDEYSSYEEFEQVLKLYKNSSCNEYWIRDARTIENQKKRFPDTVNKVNESLKYYYIRLACVKGGRPFKSKNNKSSRKCTTVKQDCEAAVFVRLSPSQKTLKVVKLNEKHNHHSSLSYFNRLSQKRLKLPKTIKYRAKQCLKAGSNKKLMLDQRQQQTGCKITLQDLINLSRRIKKKSFAECVHLLQNTYKCSSIEVWVDENSVFRGLFFQDERMKKYFNAFPEILFVDGTYCLMDLRTATYIIMVENGNGLSEIVGVCLLVNEDEEAFDFFIEIFKKYNPSWDKVQVVMSDKDKTEKKVFAKHFPNAKLMICLFHVFQIFNKDISVKKMNITASDVQESKVFLQKLTYAKSEHEYNTIYNEMIENIPEIVKEYYETNWAPIIDQWVKYLTFQNLCLSNTMNNRLENLNSNLKTVINQYSTLEDFIKNLFVYISTFRAGQDVKVSQMLNKRSEHYWKMLQQSEIGSVKALYCKLLTSFAYEKVEQQLILSDSNIDFKSIEADTFLAISTEGLLKVTPLDCECMFHKFNQLPCRHIFKCRKLLSLPLFDSSLCLNRWTRLYSENMLHACTSNLTNNFEMIGTANNKEIIKETNDNLPQSMTSNQQFKMMDDQGKIMAKLCSDVPTTIFYKRFEFIQNVIKVWSEGKDSELSSLFSEKFAKELDMKNIADANIKENYNKDKEIQEEYIYIDYTGTEVEYIVENTQTHVSDFFSDEVVQTEAEEKLRTIKNEQTPHIEEQIIEQVSDKQIMAHLNDTKMPSQMKKRGRPKKLGNTIIDLKHKKIIKTKF